MEPQAHRAEMRRDWKGVRMPIIRELGADETHLAYAAIRELRPGMSTLGEFVERVNALQRPEGYRLVGSFEEGEEGTESEAVAVAGFRVPHTLAWGRFLYVDDLVTLPAARGRGHADGLMRWLVAEAERLGCGQLHLDSGVQRLVAHRFYHAHRMSITAYHFQRALGEAAGEG
jgi:GNAT superfamily N-acetyltransferase